MLTRALVLLPDPGPKPASRRLSSRTTNHLQASLAAALTPGSAPIWAQADGITTLNSIRDLVQRQIGVLDQQEQLTPRQDVRRESYAPHAPPMRPVSANAFKQYSGILIPQYKPFPDGSQGLADWVATLSNQFKMSNIPVLSWPSCLTVHLTGAALQEFRTLQRATPDISFQQIVDSFKRTFVVCDEQKGLRAVIQSQRLVDFRDLGTFVGEYKRLVSFVETVTCPAELIAA